MRLSSCLCLIAGFAAVTATAARAQDLRVAWGDLNLARAGDAHAFQARARTAAADFCREATLSRAVTGSAKLSCHRLAMAMVEEEMPAEMRARYRVALRGSAPTQLAESASPTR